MQTMELTIKDKVYSFKAGIGFMTKANKTQFMVNEGIRVDVGLQLMVGGIMDGDVLALRDALVLMADGNPKATESIINGYLEDESTDIDALFEQVIDFFKTSNCTKKTVHKLEEEKAKRDAKNQ